ncbi:selenocysteine-specific translation elongation factor [Rhodoferax sp. BAB1]|uniref:selenocysteine-specific translation elongation factor n=1 Tax=Rhodoferax sp. BAB1 TaxID=2741720 RepID=UPI0015754692|nr:selenocysteine-specific translation elongation factor [Rhodoferax sp. BAB1]QKO21150.1 selenocysteine-specific translation elongation factor [Rhodoferax sp. BAB1]
MIIGTAGHIDHGKTALVQALTGINADRLPEEKKRGITIELGYASLSTPDGQVISFIDVPGHEKLVRTMVAGASGVDYALLLIAADDGVMPQTVEHAAILGLLGITQGAVLITKIDRATPQQIEERKTQARTLLAAHGLDGYEVLAVSAHRGDGLAELKEHLNATACQLQGRAVEGHGLRMGLDRVFTLDGIGTVVAGSIAAGQVSVGDSLCLAHDPAALYRVRSLHSHNQSLQQARAGMRCAIGLVGLERSKVERGMTLCDPAIAQSSQRIDVWLQLAPTEDKVLRSGTLVHLHAGTQDLMATVAVLGQASIAPGEAGPAQLVLQSPAHLWWGERFVLRDASARRTVGGGCVLDAQGLARYRQTPERLACLQSQRNTDAAQRLLGALAHAPFGIHGAEALRYAGLLAWPFDVAALPGVVHASKQQWLVATEQLVKSEQAVLDMLKDFHARLPEDLGPDAQRARRLAAPRMPEVLWAQLQEHLISQQQIKRRNGFLHLPAHGEQLREADRIVAERALPMLQQGRFDPPWVRDIAGTARLPEAQVRSVLARLAKSGEVFQIVKDLYYHPKVVQELAQLAREIEQREGEITAAAFRDATNLGRKRAIQILEFFDRIGYLRRVGDIHLLRPGTPLFAVEELAA